MIAASALKDLAQLVITQCFGLFYVYRDRATFIGSLTLCCFESSSQVSVALCSTCRSRFTDHGLKLDFDSGLVFWLGGGRELILRRFSLLLFSSRS